MFHNVPLIALTLQIIGWILNFVALLVVPRNRKPTAGMAWLLVIFVIPYVGWLLFLLLGTYKLPKNRRDSQRALDKLIDKRVGEISDQMIIDVPTKYRAIAKLATSMGHLPPLYGDVTHYLAAYDGAIQSIVDDIRSAEVNVYLEYFILTLDDATKDLFDALKDAVERGIEVRVLYDWWGSIKYKTYWKMKKFMKLNNISHHAMLPFQFSFTQYLRPDLRNHRKIVIIDHEIGYVGSQNMIRRNYGRKDALVYDELVVRLSGTIINSLKALFAYDWSVESNEKIHHILNATLTPDNQPGQHLMQILPSGPSYNDTNNLKVFNLAINRAEHEIFIANPYFVPSESLLSAIISAAKRGVTVRMINSATMDQWMVGHAQRSYYEELLKAGIKVYLYKKPTLLHSKFMLIDNEIGFVGSSNMDMRSFELDQEVSLILYNEKDVSHLQNIRDVYLKNSYKIDVKKWRQRKLRVQFLDNITRLTSNLQ